MSRIHVRPMSVGPTKYGGFQTLCAPYPLGCLIAYAKVHRGGHLTEHFEFDPVTPAFHQDAVARVDAMTEGGVFLFSSYVWNHEANVTVAEHVKRRFPDALVAFGGPQVPRRRPALLEFFRKHAFVDLVVRGEGEEAFAEVLDVIALASVGPDGLLTCDFSSVPGIAFRSPEFLQTAERPRVASLEGFPSPYTTGLFDHWIDGTDYLALETNRGCPYACTFCDWGAATMSKIRTMSLERVFGEIEYAGKHALSSVFICDANFGILKRDVELADRIIETHERYGFPKLVSYSASKVVRPELQQIVKKLRNSGLNAFGQISIQSTDTGVLQIIKRSNIKLSEYDKLVEFFRAEEIPGLSELMIGLPGQTLSTCKKDLQFLFDRKIHARIFPTSVMPNAPMADPAYMEQYEIRTDEEGFIESTFSFTTEEYERMFDLCRAYKLLANMGTGLFKYLLLFLELDRDVRALDYISAWLDAVRDDPARYPASRHLWQHVLSERRSTGKSTLMLAWDETVGETLFGGIDALFAEALDICESVFGTATEGTDIEAVVAAQKAVLPGRGSSPRSVPLPHDVPAYFDAVRALVKVAERSAGFKPLCEYEAGALRLDEGRTTLSYNDFTAPFVKLELRSNLSV